MCSRNSTVETRHFSFITGNHFSFCSKSQFLTYKKRFCAAGYIIFQLAMLCVRPSQPLCLSLSPLSDRAVASVLQGGCPGEQYRGEEALGMHTQHYVSRATNLRECFCYCFLCGQPSIEFCELVLQHKAAYRGGFWGGCVCVCVCRGWCQRPQ